jgi:hypothetical protein
MQCIARQPVRVFLAVNCSLAIALATGPICSVVGQPQTEPPTQPAVEQRVSDLEQRLRESKDWTFHHSIDDLPSDMRSVLFCIAGREVVNLGESFNLTDELDHASSTQHLYTAVTDDLGVIVWYSGGLFLETLVVLYDRKVRDAARYSIGKPGAVLRLRDDIWYRIEAVRGTRRGYAYLPPDFFRLRTAGVC